MTKMWKFILVFLITCFLILVRDAGTVSAVNTTTERTIVHLEDYEELINFHNITDDYPDAYHYSNANETDYAYSDIEDGVPFIDFDVPSTFKFLTLRKCYCSTDQIWNGTNCTEHHERTFVAMLDETFSQNIVYSDWFEKVDTKPLTCQGRETKVFFQGGSFNLLPNMHLFHTDTSTIANQEEYCIDHILDKEGKLSWQSEVCIPAPSVPRCCEENELMSPHTGKCIPSEEDSLEFLPYIHYRGVQFVHLNSELNDFNCTGKNDEVKRMHVEGRELNLLYTGTGTYLLWQKLHGPPVIRDPNNYCVAPVRHSVGIAYFAKFCQTDPYKDHLEQCVNDTCVRKCCLPSEVYSVEKNNCHTPDEPIKLWEPSHFHQYKEGNLSTTTQPTDLKILSGRPLCPDFFLLEADLKNDDKFYLMQNGSLHVPIWYSSVPATEYCVDNWMYEDGSIYEHAMVCFPDNSDQDDFCNDVINYIVYPILLTISCAFLVITLCVYAAVPELHAKVHGKSLLAHVSSMLVAYVSLVIVQWGATRLPMTGCIIMGKK